jgi:hypothetical protein
MALILITNYKYTSETHFYMHKLYKMRLKRDIFFAYFKNHNSSHFDTNTPYKRLFNVYTVYRDHMDVSLVNYDLFNTSIYEKPIFLKNLQISSQKLSASKTVYNITFQSIIRTTNTSIRIKNGESYFEEIKKFYCKGKNLDV